MMRTFTRKVATGLVAGALVVGAVLPALAQEDDEAPAPAATEHEPVRARVQAHDTIRDPDAVPEDREAQREARTAFREDRDAQHGERVEEAVQAGDLTREQADEMLAARQARAEGGAGRRGPGAGSGPSGDCPRR